MLSFGFHVQVYTQPQNIVVNNQINVTWTFIIDNKPLNNIKYIYVAIMYPNVSKVKWVKINWFFYIVLNAPI
jgi:hypothetical protein